MKQIKIVFKTLLFIGFFLSIGLFKGCKQEEVKPLPELRAVELPISYSAVTHIAYLKNFIAKEGLDYKVLSVPAGPDIMTALKAGGDNAADVGSIAITPIISMIAAGESPVVLATDMESNRRVQMVTFAKTGITENPATLRGKKIGVVLSTVGEIYLSKLLNKGGLTEKEVILVNGRPSDLNNLFLRHDLDAVVTWEPFVARAIHQGRKQLSATDKKSFGEPIILVDPSIYTVRFNIVTTKNKLAKKRDELVKFMKAVVRAGDFIAEKPLEARQMIEEWLNMSGSDLDGFFDTTSFWVNLDVSEIKNAMIDELQWLKKRKPDSLIPEDLSPYIDPSLLRTIDPSRVKE